MYYTLLLLHLTRVSDDILVTTRYDLPEQVLLDMTSNSWLAFGGYSGPLVYYSQILSYRCAIREMRIGIDTTVPNQVVKIPPCNPRDPSAIPENAASYMKIPASTRSVSVELTYQDGSLSEIKNFRR